MTAEVALLNKSAVALAADSAVTITTGGTPKIYNTVNKLFALSKFQPVGIMIYGMGDLLGVPWEVVIKMFRKDLGRTRFETLKEYSVAFLNFIEGNTRLFPEKVQA